MELELDKTHLSGFEPVLDTTVFHEETMEMIVPDACPDILRIVDTEARVCLGSKEATDGRTEISGTVRAAVLYLPDGEEGMRRIELAIPFVCAADAPGLTSQCSIMAVPRVQAAETRSINPRKVLVRVNLAVCVRAWAPMTDCVCSAVSGPAEAGVQQLQETHDAYVAACVQEKSFTFSDDLNISGSKPEAKELLKNRLALLCNESKVIGNKLIFKGEARLQVLYRGVENELCTMDYELPFSQIMEVTGAGEDADCTVEVVPTSVDCSLDTSGDGRTINVSLGLLAQAVVREERSVQMLADVYSTSYDLTPELQPYSMSRLVEQTVKGQTVREIVETGMLARTVLDTYVNIGTISQAREGERLTITADCTVTVLYTAEEGGVFSVTRQFPVQCSLELPEDCTCSCLCHCTEAAFATPTTGGIEIRFSVDFQYLSLSGRKVAGVTGVRVEESAPKDAGKQPSIVLRMVGARERLWDIAKHYGTTTIDIIQANELAEETTPSGRLLLIPRKR